MESTSKAIDSTPYSIMNSPKHIFISPISIRYKKIRFLVSMFFLDIILHKRIKLVFRYNYFSFSVIFLLKTPYILFCFRNNNMNPKSYSNFEDGDDFVIFCIKNHETAI